MDFVPVKIAVLTVSDTRTFETDTSGQTIIDYVLRAGHKLTDRKIITDEADLIQKTVKDWSENPEIEFVIVTGGTGVTQRDVTPEAVSPLFTKHVPGFGELFRFLSFAEIGISTIQSRADAGLVGDTIVFLLPGSPKACKLAMEKIILGQLDTTHKPCNFAELLPRIKSSC
ncbi:molybdenum cofactor biosynthesis protein B [bacterium]|nr:molybdenum cofactor biosynthesis protein B [bacterium]